MKKLHDRSSFGIRLGELATDLRVGQDVYGKIFQSRFKISKLDKSCISASDSKCGIFHLVDQEKLLF